MNRLCTSPETHAAQCLATSIASSVDQGQPPTPTKNSSRPLTSFRIAMAIQSDVVMFFGPMRSGTIQQFLERRASLMPLLRMTSPARISRQLSSLALLAIALVSTTDRVVGQQNNRRIIQGENPRKQSDISARTYL